MKRGKGLDKFSDPAYDRRKKSKTVRVLDESLNDDWSACSGGLLFGLSSKIRKVENAKHTAKRSFAPGENQVPRIGGFSDRRESSCVREHPTSKRIRIQVYSISLTTKHANPNGSERISISVALSARDSIASGIAKKRLDRSERAVRVK